MDGFLSFTISTAKVSPLNVLLYTAELEISHPLATFRPILPFGPSKILLLGQIYCTFPMGKL